MEDRILIVIITIINLLGGAGPVIQLISVQHGFHQEASPPDHVYDGVVSHEMPSSEGKEERRTRVVEE